MSRIDVSRLDFSAIEERALAHQAAQTVDRWKRDLVSGWRWRDRHGELHDPARMETRHLFHVFRMIWNNYCPPGLRVGEVRLYRFDPELYPKWYMALAVQQCGHELMGRDDITEEWQRQLNLIAGFFAYGEEVNEERLAAPKLGIEYHGKA